MLHEKKEHKPSFDVHHVIHDLKHYLPAQAPLKDFIHHNTLHAFQNLKFHDALHSASEIFGYKVSLSLNEYRKLYGEGKIKKEALERVIAEHKGTSVLSEWLEKTLNKDYDISMSPRIGLLRSNWKKQYHINLDSLVYPILFRVLCSYLDQGIAMWNFPVSKKGFLSSIREIEKNTFYGFFKSKRVRDLFINKHCEVSDLLKIVVGDESLYKQYLFDQQFGHQGWSGMVSTVEDKPDTLLDTKKISLEELIVFELLLEMDALDSKFGENWSPLAHKLKHKPIHLFAHVPETELHEVMAMWQEAFEWTYYDEVLNGLRSEKHVQKTSGTKHFQAMVCIDDRETSLRDYIEKQDPNCETFSTPGFFNVEFFFQPEFGKFYTKLCPAPVTPKYLIKEIGTKSKRKKDAHFSKQTHHLIRGWIISQILGFESAIRLVMNIFRPTAGAATSSSFSHMDKASHLTIENSNVNDIENNLQVGFTVEEMATRVEGLLKSIALIKDFAPIVYVIGHGSSSANNPHYAAYNCGACCGRPGSVNARVFAFMANHSGVRKILGERGIVIPKETQFLGGIHDTTIDEIVFYDEEALLVKNLELHFKNTKTFEKALDNNAKERSRRFASINTHLSAEKIHNKIRKRAVSLFEPRPEYNHATNALCIIGKRDLTQGLFLDRRAFTNSYDHSIDPDGKILVGIMKPIGPVCGGINLEYFFSRVDNQKLGAGTKLPHNVMGLFGVANGIDGDLRPGLPSQMIEVHDPVRLLVVVEHYPEIVLKTIQTLPEMYEWYNNAWVNIIAVHPQTKEFYKFKDGAFTKYEPLKETIKTVPDITTILEANQDNLPVYLMK